MMALLFTLTFTANAMSYEQAREQALFLTDKMAYELNLTDDQYEAAYEINLDYLMSVNSVDDLYGSYWRYRNLDMSYVLLDWQYRAFCDAAYFYRPLYFSGGYWRFGIYARYPHRDYFYFDRPRVYVSYCGGHSWRSNHGRSWYDGRHFGPRPGGDHFGMRDGFNRGDYGRGNRQSFGNRQPSPTPQRGNRQSFGSRQPASMTPQTPQTPQRGNSSFGNRASSTRTTVMQPQVGNDSPRGSFGSSRGQSSFGNGRIQPSTSNSRVSSPQSNPRPTFTPAQPQQRPSQSQPSFGSNRGSFGGSRSSAPTMSAPSRGGNSSSMGGSSSSRGGFGSRR